MSENMKMVTLLGMRHGGAHLSFLDKKIVNELSWLKVL
jgi:hypothetical protein